MIRRANIEPTPSPTEASLAENAVTKSLPSNIPPLQSIPTTQHPINEKIGTSMSETPPFEEISSSVSS